MPVEISVVTPAHEASGTIGTCLGSVAAQTVPCEHVIVDTPDQAMDCFLRTRMDAIVVNDTVIRRRPRGVDRERT